MGHSDFLYSCFDFICCGFKPFGPIAGGIGHINRVVHAVCEEVIAFYIVADTRHNTVGVEEAAPFGVVIPGV